MTSHLQWSAYKDLFSPSYQVSRSVVSFLYAEDRRTFPMDFFLQGALDGVLLLLEMWLAQPWVSRRGLMSCFHFL